MYTWEPLLLEHIKRHPELEAQDIVKFLYQSHMGPGHLVTDPSIALTRLEAEWAQVKGDASVPLSEPLGNGLCRLNLNACKGIGLSTKTVAKLFIQTANTVHSDPVGLAASLDQLAAFPLPQAGLSDYLAQYRADGCPMVRHSPAYRAAYSPAYRVVYQRFMDPIPLLAAIDRSLAAGESVRLALDGPCASGKSTLGAWLAELYQCPLIHLDDFFLLPQMRTPERLAQPGGNIDHERFDRDVLSPLSKNQPVRYRPWQCSSGDFGPEVYLPPSPLTILEGVYALRPDLRDRYTHRVWVEAPWETRRERLLARGGEGCLARFQDQWIPLEDHYFSAFQVKDCCDFVISGDG